MKPKKKPNNIDRSLPTTNRIFGCRWPHKLNLVKDPLRKYVGNISLVKYFLYANYFILSHHRGNIPLFREF